MATHTQTTAPGTDLERGGKAYEAAWASPLPESVRAPMAAAYQALSSTQAEVATEAEAEASTAALTQTTAGPTMNSGDGSVAWTNGQHPPTDSDVATIYDDHTEQVEDLRMDLGRHQYSVGRFTQIWTDNEDRYRRVAAQTGVPAELIAAIHFREGSGNFNTYLHNGQRLGTVTTIVPKGVYFEDWEEAAIDALNRFSSLRDQTGLTADTRDLATMATFAEHYNGLGYRNYRGHQSPYVYSGTTAYERGKYVADGQYSSTAVDQQLGVIAMVRIAAGDLTEEELAGSNDPWLLGDRVLREGFQGSDVAQLQLQLTEAGYSTGSVDGDFGPRTLAAVLAFQEAHDLTADGIVGEGTLAKLDTSRGHAAVVLPGTDPVAPVDVPMAQPSTDLGEDLLKRGVMGERVAALQRLLVAAGQNIVVDGDFGAATEAAVRAFQAAAELVVDGLVGPATKAALQSADRASNTTSWLTGGLSIPTQILSRGDRGENVTLLQRVLNAFGAAIGVDGQFGPATEAALINFQADAGLERTGVYDQPTIARVQSLSGMMNDFSVA